MWDLKGVGKGNIVSGNWSHAGLLFDGVDSLVEINNESAYDVGTDDWTLFSILRSSAINNGEILGKGGDNTNGVRYKIVVDTYEYGGSFGVEIDDNGNGGGIGKKNVFSTTPFNDGIDHTIMGVKDGNNLRLYIDGIEDSNSPVDISGMTSLDTSLPLVIGNFWDMDTSAYSTYQWLQGIVLHAGIYKRALSSSQIYTITAEPYSNILVPQYWFMADFGAFAAGWTGKICGVTNPSKICGVPTSSVEAV